MFRLSSANTTITVLLSVLLTALMALLVPYPGELLAARTGRGLGELLRADGTLDLASG